MHISLQNLVLNKVNNYNTGFIEHGANLVWNYFHRQYIIVLMMEDLFTLYKHW